MTISITFYFASLDINGPKSKLSFPADIFNYLAFYAILSINFWLSPTKTATDRAIHLYPQAPKAAPINVLITVSGLASGIINAWFFAPILLYTLLPYSQPFL